MKKYKFTNQVRSKAVSIANSLRAQGWSFGDALKQGWKVAKAVSEMQSGKELFIRFYKDGQDVPEQRLAVAVTSANYLAKGTGRKRNPLQITYFETTSQKVKSFNAGRFDSFRAVA